MKKEEQEELQAPLHLWCTSAPQALADDDEPHAAGVEQLQAAPAEGPPPGPPGGADEPNRRKGWGLRRHLLLAGGGLVGAIVAPVAVVAVVQGVGFTTGGIAARSIASGMMSKAAIAAGGRIAAGSTVACLQSFGALGTISGPAAIAAQGAGAMVGAGAVHTLGAVRSWLARRRGGQHGGGGAPAAAAMPAAAPSWKLAMGEGDGELEDILVLSFESEVEALQTFEAIQVQTLCRILYHPNGPAVRHSGTHPALLKAIHKRLVAGRISSLPEMRAAEH